MPIIPHTSEQNIRAGVVGGVQHGSDMAVLVAGDLTSLATAKTNVDTDVAKLHTAERLTGIRVKASLDQADNFLSGATTGSSITNITGLLSSGARGRHLRL